MKRLNEHIVLFEDERLLGVNFTDPAMKSQIRALQGQVAMQEFGDDLTVLLPWCEDSCRVLSNMGIDATIASPFLGDEHPLVEGRFTPLAHQALTAAFITLHPRCFVLNDCRLGKTGSLILAMEYMQRHRMFNGGVLVITTVTTMPSVWANGIKATLPDEQVSIVHGRQGMSLLAQPAAWYVTNYDSVRLHLPEFMQAVAQGRIGAVVVDELTHVGNSSSQRHKAIYSLINNTGVSYAVGMTGSPGSNPEPVYGMVRAINPCKLPVRTKTGWMDLTTYQYGPQPYMRKPKAGVGEVIKAALTPAIRFRKEDVLDLPPIVYQDRDCALSSEQKRMVDEFRADAVAFAKSGEIITAANAAVVMSKLLQVPLGFALSEGKTIDLDHSDRTKTILETIEETDRKVVIFCMFKHRLHVLCEEIRKAGYSCEYIDGDVNGTARSKILDDFQNKPNPKVLCCHPITVGFGTELSAADTLVFEGPPVLGGFVYMQSLERLSSTKQQASKISVIKIMASSEERAMFRRLDAGQDAGKAIAALFEEYRKGGIDNSEQKG